MFEQLHTDLNGVAAPIETSASLPPACYADADVAGLERDAVFRTSWVGIGRWDQWKNVGDYSALTIADIPVIVVRDKSQVLKAYSNSCRHRGSLMLEGSGNAQTISCPFHRWTYGLDGELRGAPDMPECATFNKCDHGLVQFRAAERDGFAFICFDDATPDLDEWLGDFSELHAPWKMGELVTTRRLELEVDCNWKGFLEVFNEYYHLPYVHPDTVANVYARPEAADAVTGKYASQFSVTEGTGGLLEATQAYALPAIPWLEGRNKSGTRYTWLFPNMTFAASTEAIWIYEATPLETGRCRVVMTVCFPPETVALDQFEECSQVYYDRMDAALAEDIPALARYHKGLASPFAKQGCYCADLEPNVASFAFWYADHMRQAI
ncbi:MAG: aromatic ring-hydroxylating dioxygenase subunit alpha [Rhodospirillales bacterium]|jgi:phenylpropionate dioxygenase-like ring-hydroxylating dioxygenase large terminal subunit|nr:aromatic ring-hydroxylating dioxygenase subunit alpha [Rhodospirillales bacterium]MBT4041351.1 aromatic ring-hydroxylating dioxygenase subunit alpha [Rhodospirillales bacterium]MBT4626275.1 aromatic ring-hydroxylating dioxygenase subunit alpha [Rhodospirillales bacterium]MBT5353057.1 aromatic ring-hydroxylating dioxygenase subunit alpha [Rhodospirillales bacterium]MBT5520535.1 aromatic ring-hydroxylating dioxygenase subunit alpha [Rhodospirillales bacterium]